MKNRTAALVSLTIALCFGFTALNATPLSNIPVNTGDTSLTLYRTDHTAETYLRLNEVNIHAARDFMKRFENVTDGKWLKIEGGYLVRFMADEKKNDAFYDGMGRFVAASCYYDGANSPEEIKTLVNKEYPGYKIIVATKINTNDRSFYRLHISNPESIKTLQIVNSRIRVLEDLQNGATVLR